METTSLAEAWPRFAAHCKAFRVKTASKLATSIFTNDHRVQASRKNWRSEKVLEELSLRECSTSYEVTEPLPARIGVVATF